jgi:cytidylate kinase
MQRPVAEGEPNSITRIVAIDGPAGAGKSSVARRAAEELGFAFLDTGAMYRAATWRALQHNVDLEDEGAVAASTAAMKLEMRDDDGRTRVFVDDVEATDAIRTPEVTRVIYKIDEKPSVRQHLVRLQQQFGAQKATVAEGRDMGTVVFPDAACKIYLDASLEERTRRRARDLERAGVQVDVEALKREIAERDERSKKRAVSPLRQAKDAVLVDTTDLSPDEVVDAIVALARKRLPQ